MKTGIRYMLTAAISAAALTVTGTTFAGGGYGWSKPGYKSGGYYKRGFGYPRYRGGPRYRGSIRHSRYAYSGWPYYPRYQPWGRSGYAYSPMFSPIAPMYAAGPHASDLGNAMNPMEHGNWTTSSEGTAMVKPGGAGEAAEVTISNMRFSPAKITIEQGETVTWKLTDSMPHTVTANDGAFDSATMSRGEEYEITFDKSGVYDYYCKLHPSMKGQIEVL